MQVRSYLAFRADCLPMDMSTETRETLARNVRIAMNLRGMKQKDLERKSEVSQKTISDVIRMNHWRRNNARE